MRGTEIKWRGWGTGTDRAEPYEQFRHLGRVQRTFISGEEKGKGRKKRKRGWGTGPVSRKGVG